jgi:hypothetical protein
LDNLIAQGKAQPMIVVMPAGHMTRGFAYKLDIAYSNCLATIEMLKKRHSSCSARKRRISCLE